VRKNAKKIGKLMEAKLAGRDRHNGGYAMRSLKMASPSPHVATPGYAPRTFTIPVAVYRWRREIYAGAEPKETDFYYRKLYFFLEGRRNG
jgi:hypothetical protein